MENPDQWDRALDALKVHEDDEITVYSAVPRPLIESAWHRVLCGQLDTMAQHAEAWHGPCAE